MIDSFYVPVVLEVRSALKDETVSLEAREKDGVKMPAITFKRQFFQGEVFDSEFPFCVVRPDRKIDFSKFPAISRGVVIRAYVTGLSIERDVPTLKVVGWELKTED